MEDVKRKDSLLLRKATKDKPGGRGGSGPTAAGQPYRLTTTEFHAAVLSAGRSFVTTG
jgi:hypothetical protein